MGISLIWNNVTPGVEAIGENASNSLEKRNEILNLLPPGAQGCCKSILLISLAQTLDAK